ncbi:MAG: DUF3280 domain-containing protein [Acetobacteraceae bacterium]|nr:DUF3280 domain-containing protein [Acetobacteraceae bacterium]
MKPWSFAAAAYLCLSPALAREPRPTAIFDFSLIDTSLQGEMTGPRSDEQERLRSLDTQLREALVRSGCCVPVNPPPGVQPGAGSDMRNCGGCDLDIARQAGAKISVIGWVQKVSNLILNVNIVARDVETGKVISVGSVDIRGNTDESWSRGLAYVLRNSLRPSEW